MRQAVLKSPRVITIEDRPVPRPGPGEVLLRVRAALTCGTDLKTYRRGHPRLPAGPFGHECAGTFFDEVPMQAVRMGPWKAVRPKPNGPLELYRLDKDPGETRDVAAENPAVMARIEEFLKRARYEPRPQRQPPHAYWEARSTGQAASR
ncbi:MAG: alcohol dehydrogenase catalytic domain-containing protein [Chloroflexi bacterium]|nr:alcohol dehydrogenase catalytic domain-containing protein [Chloroflexota bacterium]